MANHKFATFHFLSESYEIRPAFLLPIPPTSPVTVCSFGSGVHHQHAHYLQSLLDQASVQVRGVSFPSSPESFYLTSHPLSLPATYHESGYNTYLPFLLVTPHLREVISYFHTFPWQSLSLTCVFFQRQGFLTLPRKHSSHLQQIVPRRLIT